MRKRSEARSERARPSSTQEWVIETPSDPINEQCVLAAMIVDDETRERLVNMFRTPDVFYAEEHRAIFNGLSEMVRRKLAYDPATLQRLVPDVDIRIVEQLSEARPDLPPNLDYHIDTLKWDAQRAQLTRGPLAAIIEAIQNPKEAPERVRALGRQVAEAVENVNGGAPFLRDPKEVIHQAMSALRKRVSGEAFYPYNIDGLDFSESGERRLRPGVAPGMVTVLTGMSAAGKSTLAAHIVLGLARLKRRVLVGAWEVRAPMTLELLATLSLKWSRSRMLDGRSNTLREESVVMTEEELQLVERTMRGISKYVTFVDNPFRRGSVRNTGRVSNDDYLDILEQHIEASGCEIVLLDLFDRCLRWRKPDDEQEALWRVLEFTERLQIHSILVHQQLLKGNEVRADKRPSLAGLKGSSAYVDVGATIIAPHLPARFKNVPDDTIEIYGLKCRFSQPFGVEFNWDPDTGQISGGRDIEVHDDDTSDNQSAFDMNKSKKNKGGRRRK